MSIVATTTFVDPLSPEFELNETELEFDDFGTELAAAEAQSDIELEEERQAMTESMIDTGRITPEGFIDEDFEAVLGSPAQSVAEDLLRGSCNYPEIAKNRIFELAGDDSLGRKVIVCSACRLPPVTELDHSKLLLYLMETLDRFVESDYVLVYFHFGLVKANRPSFSWLVHAYKEFDRKYKKNLKALYIVHSTGFLKFIWSVFKPFISSKFRQKVVYCTYLHDLESFVQVNQLRIPERVRQYDQTILMKNKVKLRPSDTIHDYPDTQQFGVPLEFITGRLTSESDIPPVMQETITYLLENGLETEGIFRRSARLSVVKIVQDRYNAGKSVDFDDLGDIHIPAATLKSFLRELKEPLLQFELYDDIIKLQTHVESLRVEKMHQILSKMNECNYNVLKYLVWFLTKVAEQSDENKMTAENLAVVFGPSLLWPRDQASLASVHAINASVVLLITHYDQIFGS